MQIALGAKCLDSHAADALEALQRLIGSASDAASPYLARAVDHVKGKPHECNDQHKSDDAGCNDALHCGRREAGTICIVASQSLSMMFFCNIHLCLMKGHNPLFSRDHSMQASTAATATGLLRHQLSWHDSSSCVRPLHIMS